MKKEEEARKKRKRRKVSECRVLRLLLEVVSSNRATVFACVAKPWLPELSGINGVLMCGYVFSAKLHCHWSSVGVLERKEKVRQLPARATLAKHIFVTSFTSLACRNTIAGGCNRGKQVMQR